MRPIWDALDMETVTSDEDARSGGGHPVAALGVLGTAWTLAVVAVALFAVARPDWTSDQWYFLVDLSDAVVYGLVAYVLLRRARHPVPWILAVTAIGGGIAACSFQWTVLWFEDPTRYGPPWLLSAGGWGWVPGTLALIVIVPYLVRREPMGPFTRIALGAGVLMTGFFWFCVLTDPTPVLPDGGALAPFPLGGETWGQFIADSFQWQVRALVVLGLIASADVTRRWWGRPLDERRGFGWLAIGAGLMSLSFIPLALPFEVADELPVAFTPLTHLASQAFFPAALLVVILGQRLWGIELAVSRTITWSLLTGGAIAGYVALVALLDPVMPSEGGARVLATALVVGAAQPVLAWINRRVDRLVRGDATEPMRVVREVGRQLGGGGDTEQLVTDVLEGVAASLRLARVSIEVPGEHGPTELAAWGGESGEPARFPLLHGGTQVGELVVAGGPSQRLDARTLRSIEELTPVISGALTLATTTSALADSRTRLAAARDEERRTLRRELHDGLGPALAGIGLGLKAGRNLLEADPEAAGALIDQLVVELDAQVESVRDLARGLLPPALEELGLAPALAELAERYRITGLAVDLDVVDLPPVPPDVASAVYGIAAEAVRNVHRHAQATRCSLRASSNGALVLSVVDDGTGIPDDVTTGIGLRSMRERAEGVGGTLTIETASPRGTIVEVAVPAEALERRGGPP